MKQVALLITLSLIMSACSSSPQADLTPTSSNGTTRTVDQPVPTDIATIEEEENPIIIQTPEVVDQTFSPVEELLRVDEQGMVAVEVMPLNLANPGESLEFEISLNTHSVDLSMDLAPLSTLTTDTGKVIQASLWDAPRGGHHVSGKLVFPVTAGGEPILEGAKELTLIVKNLDALERVFSWELNP